MSSSPFPPPPSGSPFGTPPPPSYPAGPPQQAGGAVAALVLGILGLLLCPLCGPVAWSLGRKAEREIDRAGGRLGGRGLATAGKVLGIVGTVFLIVLVLAVIVGFGYEVSSGGESSSGSISAG